MQRFYLALIKDGVIFKIIITKAPSESMLLNALAELYNYDEVCNILNPRHQVLFEDELRNYMSK